MGTFAYASGVAIFCFAISTISVISGQSNIDCTKLNESVCCTKEECYFVQCENKTDHTANYTGCLAKTDTATLSDKCVNGTTQHVCDGPTVVGKVCSDFNTSKSCCNQTSELDCGWVSCLDKGSKPHSGCHNMTDKAEIAVICPTEYNNSCSEVTTTPKPSTTTPKASSTTPKVITTTARPPYIKFCESYNNTESCCSQDTFSCIFVANCSDTKLNGCYSHHNETDIKNKCGPVYLDKCAAITPVPQTTTTMAPTAAPSSGGRHFDGASFIGGIVLCAGIVLIIFFALKWYRSRQASNNYHQM